MASRTTKSAASTADTSAPPTEGSDDDLVVMRHPDLAATRTFTRRQARVFAKSGWVPTTTPKTSEED